MKILIGSDKYKGSLESGKVCEAIAAAIKELVPDADLEIFPLADGGEGTAAILTRQNKGKEIYLTVRGPLGAPTEAVYGLSGDGKTAYIEMAEAAGLHRITPDPETSLKSSTHGVGDMIRDALDRNVKEIILAIGGSATTDAGMGMAEALGFKFLDMRGHPVPANGLGLLELYRIDGDQAHPRIGEVGFKVACDVTNPLFGLNGAAMVYAQQKGAGPEEIGFLEIGLRNFSKVSSLFLNRKVHNVPGSGAAGGLGAGAMIFLKAILVKGPQLVFEHTGFEERVKEADMIITGEGSVDNQSFNGKLLDGILDLVSKHHKSVVIIGGRVDNDISWPKWVHGVYALCDFAPDMESSLKDPEHWLKVAVSAMVQDLKKKNILPGG